MIRRAKAFLFLTGLRLVGLAVRKAREQGLIPHDRVLMPDWLMPLGFNPTWESLGVQLLMIAVAIAYLLATLVHRRVGSTVPAE